MSPIHQICVRTALHILTPFLAVESRLTLIVFSQQCGVQKCCVVFKLKTCAAELCHSLHARQLVQIMTLTADHNVYQLSPTFVELARSYDVNNFLLVFGCCRRPEGLSGVKQV